MRVVIAVGNLVASRRGVLAALFVLMLVSALCAVSGHAGEQAPQIKIDNSQTDRSQLRSLRFEPVTIVDPATQQQLVEYEASHALIIGCSDYQHLPDLPGCGQMCRPFSKPCSSMVFRCKY